MKPVYLDYNSTTPYAPEVIQAIQESMEHFGNPSSSHTLGRKANEIIESSRSAVATMIGGNSEDIIFTSGGTEANNMAIHSAISNWSCAHVAENPPHVVTSNVEHDSVIKYLEYLALKGNIELSIVPVSIVTGKVEETKSVMSAIKVNTCLITIMHANNETGIIMPIAEIGNELKTFNELRRSFRVPPILFHSDAAQTIGKIPVSVDELGVDYLTIVGHKFYGPRIGALYARNIGPGIPFGQRTPVIPIFHGGGQERGFRSGTQNTPMIAGLGAAARLVTGNISNIKTSMEGYKSYLQYSLTTNAPNIKVNFQKIESLPNTLSICVPLNMTGAEVLKRCDDLVYASLGAACHSGSSFPSVILTNSGLSTEEAKRTIRLSVGKEMDLEEVDFAGKSLANACNEILEI